MKIKITSNSNKSLRERERERAKPIYNYKTHTGLITHRKQVDPHSNVQAIITQRLNFRYYLFIAVVKLNTPYLYKSNI